MEVSRRHVIRIAVIILLLISVLAFILIPRPGDYDIEKYQELYRRGEYRSCATALGKVLRRTPDWHAARELQIRAYLDAGMPLEAFKSMLSQREMKTSSPLETAVMSSLAKGSSGDIAKACALLADKTGKSYALNYLIQLEIASDKPVDALLHFIELTRQGSYSEDLAKKVAAACTAEHFNILDNVPPGLGQHLKFLIALNSRDYELVLSLVKQDLDSGKSDNIETLAPLLFELASRQGLVPALELARDLQREDWIDIIVSRASTADLPSLLEVIPDEPRLLIPKAINEEDPRDGLAILMDLEESGYIPSDARQYGTQKWKWLIQRGGMYDPQYFKFVPVGLIVDEIFLLAKNNPSLSLTLLEWAEPLITAHEANMLQNIITYKGPSLKEVWTGEAATDFSISPDGKWLLSSSPEEMLFVDLATGTEYPALPIGFMAWTWSPDSKKAAALESAANMDVLYLYNPAPQEDILKPQVVSLPAGLANSDILGWTDNSTLILRNYSGQNKTTFKMVEINAETGSKIRESSLREGHWLTMTSAAKPTWIHLTETSGDITLMVESNGQTDIFDLSDYYQPLEWIFNDSKLLLHQSDSLILDIKTGQTSSILLPWSYRPGNWADSKSVWGFYEYWNFDTNWKPIVQLNLETGRLHYMGELVYAEKLAYSAQGKYLAISNEFGIKLYEIP